MSVRRQPESLVGLALKVVAKNLLKADYPTLIASTLDLPDELASRLVTSILGVSETELLYLDIKDGKIKKRRVSTKPRKEGIWCLESGKCHGWTMQEGGNCVICGKEIRLTPTPKEVRVSSQRRMHPVKHKESCFKLECTGCGLHCSICKGWDRKSLLGEIIEESSENIKRRKILHSD